MGDEKELFSGDRVENEPSTTLTSELGIFHKSWLSIVSLWFGLMSKVCKFVRNAWDIGVNDPGKLMHGVKVGAALSVVSLLYYMRPLYYSVGGNAMWAVLTVVVVFENNVGATISKSFNRMMATFLAGALAVGVHWIGCHSGKPFEPIIIRASVFLLAVTATFSRFIPTIKARFDYGASIFILTFTVVSVSSYRIDNLFVFAQQRLSTVAIGASMCILVSIIISPIWAGRDLHFHITCNLEKLADSLDGCVVEYFKEDKDRNHGESFKRLQGYKCTLNSKGLEESLCNFARWEPAHGCFSFRHPWKQYLKVGSSMRSCASCIEALVGSCINSKIKVHESTKQPLRNLCMRLSCHSSAVLKELATIIKSMRRSSRLLLLTEEMRIAAKELQHVLKSQPHQPIPSPSPQNFDFTSTLKNLRLIQVMPLLTVTSLLIEIATWVERSVDEVDELSRLANFKLANDEKPHPDLREQNIMKTLQLV
ncbi:hypothetical protein Scep_022525 [Stephania cephalantha]|uniref:Aluminum-activated malate transporter n=1 Tax=Stephania cephalantha TaxID=152367 RepID=A0AAP0F5J8_9MAGN